MIQIIVVDDAVSERTIAAGLLKRAMKCEIRQAGDGNAAIELIEIAEPDIVITDLNMPGMDGLELVQSIGEDYPNIPVVVMTAMGSEETAARTMRAGAASYVPKRRLAQDLVTTVQQILEGRTLSATPARVLSHMETCRMSLRLRNDPTLVHDAASMLQRMLVCLPLGSEGERTRVGVAIEAALSNALLRGNLDIPRVESRSADDLQSIVNERLMQSPWRERQIHVVADISRERAEITIRDEGPGFDVTSLELDAQRSLANTNSGRGLVLMYAIMDSVVFNACGNEVIMTRNRLVVPEADDDDE
jgi:DNA-binding NarL/FixJ family response regulator